jgi:hypothetical protein
MKTTSTRRPCDLVADSPPPFRKFVPAASCLIVQHESFPLLAARSAMIRTGFFRESGKGYPENRTKRGRGVRKSVRFLRASQNLFMICAMTP